MDLDANGKKLIELDGYDLMGDMDNVESDYLNIMIRVFKIHLGAMMTMNGGAINEKGLVDIFEDLQNILQSEVNKDIKDGKRGVSVFIDGFSNLEKLALELEAVIPKKDDRKAVSGSDKEEGEVGT